jgi:putative DNA primase/helicase
MGMALANRYHPVREWLLSLRWDGVARCNTWLNDYCGLAERNIGTEFISRTAVLAPIYRVMKPGCQYDTMIIFEGDQGIGKSQAVRALGGQWYKSVSLTERDHNTVQIMKSAWILEVAELSVFAKRDIESLRAFISTPIDSGRFAYGRNDYVLPRQSVFIGTINPESNGYLMDTTGNRRFLPVKLNNINVRGIEDSRHQLFAEAYQMYLNRVPIHVDSAELKDCISSMQKAREFHDDWEPEIINWIDRNRLDSTHLFTAMDIYVRVFGGRIENYDGRVSRRIGNILRKVSGKEPHATTINGVRGKYYDLSSLMEVEKVEDVGFEE